MARKSIERQVETNTILLWTVLGASALMFLSTSNKLNTLKREIREIKGG